MHLTSSRFKKKKQTEMSLGMAVPKHQVLEMAEYTSADVVIV